jgi:hypothetical protein
VTRIVGVETFFAENVALVRVCTEDGHEDWGPGQVAPFSLAVATGCRRCRQTLTSPRAHRPHHRRS